MAKKQLTIEEKLQAALVPAEEQPYKVPDNWCWWKLKSFSEIRTGKKDANYGTENGKYLFFTCASAPIRCDGYSFEGKSILLAGNGDIGNISLYEGKFEAYQRTYVLDIEKSLSTEYVYYYFKYKWVDYNNDKMYGSAIPYIRLGNLKEFPLPVPPVKEQNHIVSIIESFFAKLDEAKEKIQEVLDGADLRRAAILHQAFTGKLTEKWRRENGVSDDSRETSNVKSICNSLKYGTAKKSVQDGDVAVLRMGNLQNGEIDWGSLVYSNDQDDIEKYSLKDGDVLFNRTNSAELVGKTSIYRGERPAIYAGYLIKLDYKRDKIIGDFFNYMLNSPKAKEYCNKVKTDGVNQSNINAKKIGAFEFDVPTILEQQEIVRLLDNLLSREQSTVTACEEALTIIDTLKKSILARAFRGELGTNDPSEAGAQELLQEILAS
ncbi:MAG: restriction endonuclease subunit S [Selenomonadaceae bacterium]|nr:restriction endonuclease subunit S [Selenomonadaceae bacterium]